MADRQTDFPLDTIINQNAIGFGVERKRLFGIAYRIVGSVMDAEDIVQEAFIRWQGIDQTNVLEPQAYLTTVVTRLAIDHLKSAKIQRERYIGSWMPEPLLERESTNMEESVALAESVSIAFLVLLESLNPTERAIFLLHDVFEYRYKEIAEIVGKSEANCRQIGHRAREHIAARRPRFEPSMQKKQQLLNQFMRTISSGDMPGLIDLLAVDVTTYSDSNGRVPASRNPVYGVHKVSRTLMGAKRLIPKDGRVEIVRANSQPAIFIYKGEEIYAAIFPDLSTKPIQAIYNLLNPEKLCKIKRSSHMSV